MFLPPSNLGEYVLICSLDPALDAPGPAPGDDATEEQRAAWKEWVRRLDVARETGEWGPVLKPGSKPTRFRVRQIPGTTRRRIADHVEREGSVRQAFALWLRAALRSVENLGDHQVKLVHDDVAGEQIASVEIVDTLDGIDRGIVNELGILVANRVASLSPKS